MAEGASPRAVAARVLDQVTGQGRSLSDALPGALTRLNPQDRALTQELCYGVLRWLPRLEALLATLLGKPLKARDNDLRSLLLIGLYQLIYLETPPHAAVSETVAAVERLKKGWAKGLVNGVLRNFQRDAQRLIERIDREDAVRFAHPVWLLDALKAAWPDHWQTIAQANNTRPPMTIRVNRRFQDRESYIQELAKSGIHAEPTPHAPAGLIIEPPVSVDQLPGFFAGRASVQDAAAQLSGEVLTLQPGQRVLDACAAPGGKTGHILEQVEPLDVTAIDKDAERLTKVRDNLTRLGVAANVLTGDAAMPDQWWDGVPFDRILLDAPCSATGVIRRHPDIKILRQPSDIPALVEQQARLLDALWPLLRPGGILVYATCSVLPEENSLQLARFLEKERSAKEIPLVVDWGHPTEVGRQLLPGEDRMDGFYYARLGKQ